LSVPRLSCSTVEAVRLDDLLDLLAERRGITRQQARERLAAMPGGGELLSGAVPVDDSPLTAELLADDPE
jgi:hypothetical protein